MFFGSRLGHRPSYNIKIRTIDPSTVLESGLNLPIRLRGDSLNCKVPPLFTTSCITFLVPDLWLLLQRKCTGCRRHRHNSLRLSSCPSRVVTSSTSHYNLATSPLSVSSRSRCRDTHSKSSSATQTNTPSVCMTLKRETFSSRPPTKISSGFASSLNLNRS